jgi:hypothetical protein
MISDDPLLSHWGLHDLLEGYSSTGIGRTTVQLSDHSRTEFFEPEQSYTVRGYSSFENDEAIADSLQEDEGSARFHDWGEHSYTGMPSCSMYSCLYYTKRKWRFRNSFVKILEVDTEALEH